MSSLPSCEAAVTAPRLAAAAARYGVYRSSSERPVRNADLRRLAMLHDRHTPQLMSNLSLLTLGIATVAFPLVLSGRTAPVGVGLFAIMAPNIMIALGVLVVYYAGHVDLSIPGQFAILMALLAGPLPMSDMTVVGIIIIGMGLGALVGMMLWSAKASFLASFLMLGVARAVAVSIDGGSNVTVDIERSYILSAVSAEALGVSICLVFVALIAAGVHFGFRSGYGRRLRAVGLDPRRAAAADICPARVRVCAHIAAGGLTSLAAILAVARTGTSSSLVGEYIVFDTFAIVVIANGGLERWCPSVMRLVASFILVTVAGVQMSAISWTHSRGNILIGSICLLTISGSYLLRYKRLGQNGEP